MIEILAIGSGKKSVIDRVEERIKELTSKKKEYNAAYINTKVEELAWVKNLLQENEENEI